MKTRARRLPPNKRLKLTGGGRLKGSGVLVPLAGRGLRPPALRRRAGRPQLKRDPLGGALPPHRHPFVNSFCSVNTRGADAPEQRSVRRAPHPTAALRGGRAAHVLPAGGCPLAPSQPPGGRELPDTRRRARAWVRSAPSNTRLELAAPGGQGRIPFVTNQARRRSSSAIR